MFGHPKGRQSKYKTERGNSTICLCCKLYKDTIDFVPANKFKYCIGCRENKAKYKKDITPPPSPTHSEIERRPDTTATPIIQNRRKLHRNIEVNLSMLYQYFKERYNIQETEQELFNNWERIKRLKQVYMDTLNYIWNTYRHINIAYRQILNNIKVI